MLSKILLMKETTRITGLAVAKNPHHSLTVLYEKILRTLEKIPDSAAYKQHTKQLVNERLNLVKTIKDPVELEKRLDPGYQVEEAIRDAENELILARKMVEWKSWEPLIGQAPKNQWKWPTA
jgi:NADH dehydrogenase (ubiquinone) 1 alpha subcomplex subunit 5